MIGLVVKSFAISLGPDKLIYKGHTLNINIEPLQPLYGKNSQGPTFFPEEKSLVKINNK